MMPLQCPAWIADLANLKERERGTKGKALEFDFDVDW